MDNSKRDVQFHIKFSREDNVGRYCILPGDPGRCESIAALFDDPIHLMTNRETSTPFFQASSNSGLVITESRAKSGLCLQHRHRRPLRGHCHGRTEGDRRGYLY